MSGNPVTFGHVASPEYSRHVRDFLHQCFLTRWIGHDGPGYGHRGRLTSPSTYYIFAAV
jgi:hypothetical protein